MFSNKKRGSKQYGFSVIYCDSAIGSLVVIIFLIFLIKKLRNGREGFEGVKKYCIFQKDLIK